MAMVEPCTNCGKPAKDMRLYIGDAHEANAVRCEHCIVQGFGERPQFNLIELGLDAEPARHFYIKLDGTVFEFHQDGSVSVITKRG